MSKASQKFTGSGTKKRGRRSTSNEDTSLWSPAPGNKMQYNTNSVVIRHENGYSRNSPAISLRATRQGGASYGRKSSSWNKNDPPSAHVPMRSHLAAGRSSSRSYNMIGAVTSQHWKHNARSYEHHGNTRVCSKTSFPSDNRSYSDHRVHTNYHRSLEIKSSRFKDEVESNTNGDLMSSHRPISFTLVQRYANGGGAMNQRYTSKHFNYGDGGFMVTSTARARKRKRRHVTRWQRGYPSHSFVTQTARRERKKSGTLTISATKVTRYMSVMMPAFS